MQFYLHRLNIERFDIEIEICWENEVKSMAADAMATQGGRFSSAWF